MMFRNILNKIHDRERCGVIIGLPDTVHVAPPSSGVVVELPNRAADPTTEFVILRDDLDTALWGAGATMRAVIGFWHTHPHPFAPEPSEADWASIMLGEKFWWHAVIHPESGTVTWYDYNENVFEEVHK